MSYVFLVISSSKTSFVRNYCLESIKLCGISEDRIFVTLDDSSDTLIYGNRILVRSKEFLGSVIEACDFLDNINISNLVLILDDFIFESISDELDSVVAGSNSLLPYLRLTPIEYVRKYSKSLIIPIPSDHPYYSSLQVAYWSRDYLKELALIAESIWGLEKLNVGYPHFSVCKSLITYKHIVEKGKWDYRARSILKSRGLVFNFNGIGIHNISKLRIIKNILIMKIVLPIFGYKFLK